MCTHVPFDSHPHNFLRDCGAAAGWLRLNPSAACAVCAVPPPPPPLMTAKEELQCLAGPETCQRSVTPQVPAAK